jgi:hypothetical protein
MAKHLQRIGSKHLRTIAFLVALALIGAAPPPTEVHAGGATPGQASKSLTMR